MTKVGSSGKGGRIKKEEEDDASLASIGQQGKMKKEDISKVTCFHCGELGRYAYQCLKKKNKGEVSDSKEAPTKANKEVKTEDDCALSAHAPLEKWRGDIEL